MSHFRRRLEQFEDEHGDYYELLHRDLDDKDRDRLLQAHHALVIQHTAWLMGYERARRDWPETVDEHW